MEIRGCVFHWTQADGERYVKIVGLYDNCPALQLGMKLAKISTVLCNGLNRSYCHVVQRTLHIFGKNS